jgi:hypothetical protein
MTAVVWFNPERLGVDLDDDSTVQPRVAAAVGLLSLPPSDDDSSTDHPRAMATGHVFLFGNGTFCRPDQADERYISFLEDTYFSSINFCCQKIAFLSAKG